MNSFLCTLFESIAIDVNHLNSYLSDIEWKYLEVNFKSKNSFDNDFYTDEIGENLEVLLKFFWCHKREINQLLIDPSNKDLLIDLYTSSVISASYDCFRFDLSKFNRKYTPTGAKLSLYRVGRLNENSSCLGNSWSKSLKGLKCYSQASSIDTSIRPVFKVTIDDSEVLFKGSEIEDELVLKLNFNFYGYQLLDNNQRNEIFN